MPQTNKKMCFAKEKWKKIGSFDNFCKSIHCKILDCFSSMVARKQVEHQSTYSELRPLPSFHVDFKVWHDSCVLIMQILYTQILTAVQHTRTQQHRFLELLDTVNFQEQNFNLREASGLSVLSQIKKKKRCNMTNLQISVIGALSRPAQIIARTRSQ